MAVRSRTHDSAADGTYGTDPLTPSSGTSRAFPAYRALLFYRLMRTGATGRASAPRSAPRLPVSTRGDRSFHQGSATGRARPPLWFPVVRSARRRSSPVPFALSPDSAPGRSWSRCAHQSRGTVTSRAKSCRACLGRRGLLFAPGGSALERARWLCSWTPRVAGWALVVAIGVGGGGLGRCGRSDGRPCRRDGRLKQRARSASQRTMSGQIPSQRLSEGRTSQQIPANDER